MWLHTIGNVSPGIPAVSAAQRASGRYVTKKPRNGGKRMGSRMRKANVAKEARYLFRTMKTAIWESVTPGGLA
jgi:hypothetical protein